jgi:hypothetical protein
MIYASIRAKNNWTILVKVFAGFWGILGSFGVISSSV